MSTKKALLVLSPFIALLILSFLMIALGQIRVPGNEANPQDLNKPLPSKVSDPKNEEVEEIEAVINQKIEQKMEQIEKKPVGQAFSQEEIDFLVNPRGAAMDEVIESSTKKPDLSE